MNRISHIIITLFFIMGGIYISLLPIYASEDDYSDNISGAASIELGTDISAKMNQLGDKDYFSFVPEKSGKHHLTMTIMSSSSVSMYTFIYDQKGNIVKNSNSTDFNLCAGNTYYLMVTNEFFVSEYLYKVNISFIGDDYGDSITSASSIDIGTEIFGNVESTEDRDYFSITPTKSGIYTFETFGNVAVSGTIYDKSGQSIKGNYPTYTNITLSTALQGGETYYFALSSAVKGDSYTGSYSFSISYSVDDYGDNMTEATSISLETENRGAIDYKGDRDFLKITIPENGYYLIEATGDIEEELYWQSGQYISRFNNYYNSILYANQTYYIDVHGSSFDKTGAYSIKITHLKDDYGDNIASAYPITVGAIVKGQIQNVEDNDYFCFTTPSEGYYFIDCTGHTDIFGSLYNEAGVEISSDLRGEGSFYSPIAMQLEANKKYYLKIRNGWGKCDYTLSVKKVGDDHSNEISSATAIQLNELVPGNIDVYGDVDCFKFIPEKSGSYSIRTTGDRYTTGYLYDSNGNLILKKTGGADYNFYVTTNLEKQKTYFIKICCDTEGFGKKVMIGGYYLKIEFNEEDEYSDTFNDTTEVLIGTEKLGKINHNGDIDVFRLQTDEDGTYDIKCMKKDGKMLTPLITLYDNNYNRLSSDKGLVSYLLQKNTTYYISIEDFYRVFTGYYGILISKNIEAHQDNTSDTIPPAWSSGYPQLGSTGKSVIEIKLKTDEDGIAYYVCLPAGSATPSSIQVRSGKDSSGNDIINRFYGYIELEKDKEGVVTLSGLTGSDYDVYIVAQDNKINLQSEVKKVSVKLQADKIDECFIATAAYGSKFEPAVVLLRQFRDRFLLTNKLGNMFVSFYYKNSPPIADFISSSKVLKLIVRILLIPFILMAYLLFHPIILVILSILLVYAIFIIKKRRLYR